MNVFIAYAHPSRNAFTHHVLLAFLRGLLVSAGHRHTVSDLYAMDFRTDMSEAEYLRESSYRRDLPVPPDGLAEQEKIDRSDAIVFIYPVFWTKAPAKWMGWFDRVWTYDFAYRENRRMKPLEKALVICIAGHDREHLDADGHTDAIRAVMLGHRLYDRARTQDLLILDATAKLDLRTRQANRDPHLQRAFSTGASL